MIKFFRKIRQNLLLENKTSKYFSYAIGEIVLVVIGILIALSINNWNEERKAAIQEEIVLKSLYNNLKLAKQQSQLLIKEENDLKHVLIRLLDLGSVPNPSFVETISDSIFKNAVWDLQSDLPILNTYLNLKNTNQLGLIKSKEVNEKFSELDFKYNKLIDLLHDRLSVHQIRIDNILENDINFLPLVKSNVPDIDIEREISTNYSDILKNRRVRNLLGMKLTFTQDIVDRRLELDLEIQNLLILIDSQLTNKW